MPTGRAPEQRMAAPHDQARLLDAERQAVEQPGVEIVGHPRDDEIEPRGEEIAREHVANVDLDVEFDLRRQSRGFRVIAGAARSNAGAVTAPSETTPRRPARRSVNSCSAWASCSSTERARRASDWPSGVSRTPRESRSHSRASSSASISADHPRGGRLRHVQRLRGGADHAGVLDRGDQAQMRQASAGSAAESWRRGAPRPRVGRNNFDSGMDFPRYTKIG